MAIISGTSASETLNGTASADTIRGYAGNDIINGNGGNDVLFGGGGNDTLNGGTGNDTVYGGTGNDTILFQAGGGQDIVNGFAAGDIVKISGYSHASVAQSGSNVIVALSSTDRITFTNTDIITVGAALRFTSGSSGGTNTITGTAGADVLTGTSGADILQGLGGNDQLIGGAGNDRLYGGAGDDWIRASANDGIDQIYGDLGADRLELSPGDVIHYSSYQQSGAGFGVDGAVPLGPSDPWTIDFTGFDANLELAGQQKLVFVGRTNTPAIGQLAEITTSDFLHIPIGLGANLDSDPSLEFFVAYSWEFQARPTFIF